MAILLIVIFFAAMWALLIRPKQRELKRHNQLVATLDVGDVVMIGAGVYGTLTEVTDDTVWLEIAPEVTIKVARRAVAAKVAPAVDDEPMANEDEARGSSEEALALDPHPEPEALDADVEPDLVGDDPGDLDGADGDARSEEGR